MRPELPLDETLVQRLPLPLAQLYRRSHNAKTPLERHQAAYYLWEAALKLLGSVAVVEYAERGEPDASLAERLQNLARPSVGHWWEFVRCLTPVLADGGDPSFVKVCELLLGRTRDDLPRAAGLDAALREALDSRSTARNTVKPSELFDQLVRYRNRFLGHGATGQQPAEFYQRMGSALRSGLAELLSRLDVLAGRRLVFVAEVRRQADGAWLVERYELIGESARRLAVLQLAATENTHLPNPERLYLESLRPEGESPGDPLGLRSLHPLVIYEADNNEVLFLNARRGKQRTEYLSYTTGRVTERADLAGEQRALLAQVLHMTVEPVAVESWAGRSQAEEETNGTAVEEPGAERQLGEFELLSELGRGGMGIVYRAWQPSLGRQVAVKCLFRTGDPKAEARFAREIHALGRVEHPHLVKIFTSGTDGDQWFYAMELLEGTPLSAVCDKLHAECCSPATVDWPTWQTTLSAVCEQTRRAEKPLSTTHIESAPNPAESVPASPVAPSPPGGTYVRTVVEMVQQVAEAAHALHEAGIIHRDIKPGNIVITTDGGQAVLMDLGLAQLADNVQGRLTQTRQFVGTLRYASPEQVLAVGNLDRRSDVYSLGVTLWELLTLQPMFGADDQTSVPELMRRIQYEEPERVRKYHPQVPRDLEAIVRKCLEKDANRRYPTARELADDLTRWLDGKPVLAHAPTLSYVVGKYVRRHRARIATALVLLLAGLTGAVLAVYRIDAERRRAEESAERFENERDEADRLRLRAENSEFQARQNLYVSDMQVAARAWEEGQIDLVRELLKRHEPGPGETDLRGFEWRLLAQRARLDGLRALDGHRTAVTSIAFDATGTILASASADGTIHLWNAATGAPVRTLYLKEVNGRLGFKSDADKGGYVVTFVDPKGAAGRDGHLHKGDRIVALVGPDGKEISVAGMTGVEFTQRIWGPSGTEVVLVIEPTGATDVQRQTLALRRSPAPSDAPAGFVPRIAFHPKLHILAATTPTGGVRLWDCERGEELHTPKAEQASAPISLVGLAFSPDGEILATADTTGKVVLWQVSTGLTKLTIQPSFQALIDNVHCMALAYAPDGRTVATVNQLGNWTSWDTLSGEVRSSVWGNIAEVKALAFSPDGQTLALGMAQLSDDSLCLADVGTGRVRSHLRGHAFWVTSLAFAPDGRTVLTGSEDRTAKLWDVATGLVLNTFKGHTAAVLAVAFSPDGRRAATAGADGKVILWDPSRDQESEPLGDKTDGWMASLLAFTPDGQALITAGSSYHLPAAGGLQVYGVSTRGPATTLQGRPSRIEALDFAPDGQSLLTFEQERSSVSGGGEFKVRDLATGKIQVHFRVPSGLTVQEVRLSHDGKTLALALGDAVRNLTPGEVQIWDVHEGVRRFSLNGGFRGVNAGLAFSSDDKTLFGASTQIDVAGSPSEVQVWDLETRKLRATFRDNLRYVYSFALSPDDRLLALGTGDVLNPAVPGMVLLLDSSTGQQVANLSGHSGAVNQLDFAPDGKALASAGVDKSLKLWDLSTKQLLHSFMLPSSLRSIQFAPGGRSLLTGSKVATDVGVDMKGDDAADPSRMKCEARLWDVANRKEGRVLDVRAVANLCARFSHDGRSIAVGTSEGIVKLFDSETLQERLPLEGGVPTFEGHRNAITAMAISPDGQTVVTGGLDQTIRLWDRASGKLRTTWSTQGAPVTCLSFSPDGTKLASGTGGGILSVAEGELKLWDWRAGSSTKLAHHPAGFVCLAFAPDGQTLAYGTSYFNFPRPPKEPVGQVKILDVTDGAVRGTYPEPANPLNLAFAPDGQCLAFNDGPEMVVWRPSGTQRLRGHYQGISAFAFAPDGRTLVTGSNDGTVKLWNVATGQELFSLRKSAEWILGMAFSPDGTTLAVSSKSGLGSVIRIWSTTGRTR
jgi:WD40 repeat protein/serine/threonine protein kinase